MTRSAYRLGISIAILVALAPVSRADDPPPGDRPNILWITCEDISPHLGCYGDPLAHTEQLDRLAGRSVRYAKAFATISVCAPTRSSLITGVWPTKLGSHNMRSHIELPETIHCFPAYLRQAGYYCTNNVKTDYNFDTPPDAWDESSRRAHWRKRPEGRPFFSVFNFTVSHESQVRLPDEAFAERTARLRPDQRQDPDHMPVPPMHPDAPEVRRDWARYYELITALDYQVGDLLADLEADGLADNTIVFFFSDHGTGMPGYKRWLWDAGLHVPLIIHVPERYRHLATDPSSTVTDRLVSFIDFAPTVLSLAGVPIPAHMDGQVFLGPQAADPREYVHAFRDRMDERYDCVRAVRGAHFHYIRNFMPHQTWAQYQSYQYETPTMQVWQRRADAGELHGLARRFFERTKPVEELYDTAADPHQVHNLAGDPKYADVLERFRAELLRWMADTRDLGLLPEYEMHKRSAGTTPYAMRQDPERYPFERVLEAALSASAMEPARAPELELLLRDAEPAVRYWAAVGLGGLGERASDSAGLLVAALADPAPNVRVAAADALCRMDQCELALPTLNAALQHESPFIRLRALNALDWAGPHAKPLLPAIRNVRTESPDVPHFDRYLDRVRERILDVLAE